MSRQTCLVVLAAAVGSSDSSLGSIRCVGGPHSRGTGSRVCQLVQPNVCASRCCRAGLLCLHDAHTSSLKRCPAAWLIIVLPLTVHDADCLHVCPNTALVTGAPCAIQMNAELRRQHHVDSCCVISLLCGVALLVACNPIHLSSLERSRFGQCKPCGGLGTW